jgi:hypothetical protein
MGMLFLSKLRKQALQPLLHLTFPHPVWRLISSSEGDASWLVELRISNTKTVEYYFFQAGKPYTKLDQNLGWWSGIETLHRHWAIFHGFSQPDMPIHQGITVIDCLQNKVAWQNEYLQFDSAKSDLVKARYTIGNQPQALFFNLRDGSEAEESFETSEEANTENVLYFQEHPHFKDIQAFIHQETQHIAQTLVEYVETSQHLLLSYFTTANKLTDTYLLVCDNSGTILLHECLAKGNKGVAKGTFQVSNGLLSFVKDKNQVFVYQL